MGSRPSKVRKPPIKSVNPSSRSDKEECGEVNRNGSVNHQNHDRHLTSQDSTTPERQTAHPKTQLNQPACRGERKPHSLDANNTQTNVGSQRDFGKRPKRRFVQATYRSCLRLTIRVLRGRNITIGGLEGMIDTPDPYVKLFIPTSPNGKRRTKVQRNTSNPEWDEMFQFFLDPDKMNLLQITLMDCDIFHDDLVEKEIFELGTLKVDETYEKTFTFRKVSEVDVEMRVENCTASEDMRYSMELCEEEEEFLSKRKQFVFDSMKTFLGERGPKTIDEVPTVAVLGSGGGFRAMVSLSGVFCALKDMGVLDCAMYAAGLSGSAWYLSTLYSHPEWPYVHPRVIRKTLQENVNDNWMWLLITPSWMYRHLKIIVKKKRQGQPVSFTDFFGYLVGETILKDRDDIPKLSQQRKKIKDATVPFPLYTCVHVKKDVSAKEYCEWLEFSPFEIGIARYGTYMRTERFGSKFFCGKLVAPYPEPPLHYLQGLWGSAFTILLQRVLTEGRIPDDTIADMSNRGDLREELREMIDCQDGRDDVDSDSDNEEDDDDDVDGVMLENNNSDEIKENDKDGKGFFGRFFEVLVDKLAVFRTRTGRAGLVHNFLRGLQILAAPFLSEGDDEDVTADAADELALNSRHIYLVDGGLVFNSPFPPLLRPQRKVDVFISFDFSVRKRDVEFPFEELLLAEKWAREHNMKFPPITAELQYRKHGIKEFYIFRDPNDPTCPILIHFLLANKTFKEESRPGIFRCTEEEIDYANFSLFEGRHNPYSTFNFHYRENEFSRLADLNEFNTLLGEQTIKDILADCVKRRRQQTVESS
ncbi:unnamed protein product [Pocillopora meandrina]|uniref:Phospholipase A2 n=1 Tax=Pocillopora meandrina TaxID=46732 RepID=A0AAU9WWW0_9CNID|nr:unnamed protein product [Pocillopora meandrina]